MSTSSTAPIISPDSDPAVFSLSTKLQDINRRGVAYFAANPGARWLPPVLAAELAALLDEAKAIIEGEERIGFLHRMSLTMCLKAAAAALRKMTAPRVLS